MIRTKKTFGEHIEDGLTFMGDGIHRAVKETRDHELEYIKSGWISDVEKLKMLKRDLYEAARSHATAEHIQNLTRAIATISNQIETDRNYRNSPVYQIYGILNSIILLSILAAFFSFPATWVCNVSKSQSKACQVSRVIPTATLQFFSEPK